MIKKFLSWLSPSFQGIDGKSSARALTNFWYVLLNSSVTICVVVLGFIIAIKPEVNNYAVDVMWVLVWLIVIYNLTVLLIFGIISIQNVIELSKSIRGKDDTEKEENKGEQV
jgi:beta-lactamase regulating signal transducer with metallopeptidase domain